MTTILIPAYNEEERIGGCLSSLLKEVPSARTVVVFDGTDRTPEVAKGFPGVTVREMGRRVGKGGALIQGIRESAGDDVVVLMDADLPVSPRDVERAVEAMGDADMLVARRVYEGIPALRYALHDAFNALAKLLFPPLRRFNDWQGGFKVFREGRALSVLDELVLSDFIIDTNMLYAFLRRGYRVIEYPVMWHHEERGSKVSGKVFKVVLMDFLSLVKLRVYYSPARAVLGTKAFRSAQEFALKVLRRGKPRSDPAEGRLIEGRFAWRALIRPCEKDAMRILWFGHRDIKHPRAGGAERTIHEVGRRLATGGHEFFLFSVNPGNLPREEVIDGIRGGRAPGNLAAHFLVPMAIKKVDPDVV
ncbi:MAG: glycosyltransferase, partial [Conexivisphaerales archaeon]|nr:glycosyltransferase [Conexivisphaerales archaeon]